MDICVDCDAPTTCGSRCEECLAEVSETPRWLNAGSKPTPGRLKPHSTCSVAECGHVVPKRPGRVPAFCMACRVRECPHCGTRFVPYQANLKYCSTECSRASRSEHYAAMRQAVCCEPGCDRPRRRKKTPRCGPCDRARYPEDPDKVRARMRRKTYWRKAKTKRSDFSAEAERQLRAKAKRCPLCAVRLLGQPYLPASKELDHMVPLNIGGTHTIGNVRIICRSCNVRRPKDGSDYTGPVTLFALEVA